MDKETVIMRNWQLSVCDDNYNLSGIAEKHPILGKDAHISYTTHLVKCKLEDNVLTYETKNTIYKCPLKYMNVHPSNGAMANQISKSDNCLDRIISIAVRFSLNMEQEDELGTYIMKVAGQGRIEIDNKITAYEAHLIEIAEKYENCIYLEVSNIDKGNKLAYHFGNYSGIIEPWLHVGMRQDSVLYIKDKINDDDVAVDFRYFPHIQSMETYSWSDNIDIAVIKNEMEDNIRFNDKLIEPGKTELFTMEYHSEGLISPDCFNGKNMFKK